MADELDESAEDAAYRAKARAWLAENAAEYKDAAPIAETEIPAYAKAWTRRKWDAGYSGIDVPESAGGAGGTSRQAQIFAEEERRHDVPRGSAHQLVVAAYMNHATPEQIKRWGTAMWSGAGNWTQLFSEPSGGSDLAALRTRAVKQGDKYIINGQKIWSTRAHQADFGFMIARTDPKIPKHKGLSFFFLNMRQPGITVRPIRQMTGAADFNEVFFVDAEVSEADRIGAEGEGWAVAMTVLAAERQIGPASASDDPGESPSSTRNLLRAAKKARRGNGVALDSAAVRSKIAQWYVEEQGVRNFALRMQQSMAAGAPVPPTMPIMKLTSAHRNQQVLAFLMDLEDFGGIVKDVSEPAEKDKFYDYLYSPIWRIAGGADEVMRNQLSERALGMPSDVRIDKNVPFDELPF